MNLPIWSKRYVGIDYVAGGRSYGGLDCYGLVCLVYREILGIVLPTYTGDYDADNNESSTQALGLASKRGWQKETEPFVGCVVLLNIANKPRHVGIYLGNGFMIHCMKGRNTTIERVTTPEWRYRVKGYYSHA